jgi:23S rRNA (uracil1939-C5)-methyltransferase
VGLHPYDQPGRVFGLADCAIMDPRLTALWRDVRAHAALWPADLTRLTLRLDRTGGRHVIAESAAPWDGAAELRAALPEAEGVVCWWQPPEDTARVVAGGATGFPATAFEQVNPEMGDVVRRWAVERLGTVRGQRAWDRYGGVGDTAVALAEAGAEVVSVDADGAAVAWAEQHHARPGARYVAAKAEDVVGTLPAPYAVVVNPPRAGLHSDVSGRLARAPVPRLAYLSRDPATLARDLQRLGAAYRVLAVRAFDLFPQTAHVETVVVLEAV